MVRLTYARKNPLQEILNRLDVLESAPPGGVTSAFGRTGAVVGATNDYNWAQIDKTTSSLADLATKSAAALTSGTLDEARLPSSAYRSGGTDVAVADGGTGASTESGARTNLGLAIGSDVQAYSAVLAGTTASFTTADETKLDGIEALADVTDAANVDAAGALMESEVDADIKTLSLPASTTISAFGATLVDDADNTAARSTLGLGTMATQAETGYALLAGRSGGQTLYGGTGSGDDLLLRSTSNATEGYILGQADDLWGIGGVTTPVSGNFATFSDVASPTRTGTTKGITVAAATDPTLTAKNTATGAELAVGGFGSGGLGIGSVSSTNLAFYRGGTEMLTLSSAGLGLRTNDPKSGIDLQGSISYKRRASALTTETLGSTDYYLGMTNAAARTVNLPTAVGIAGRIYIIGDEAGTATTAPITLDPDGTETIGGSSTYNIDRNLGAAWVISDNANWRILASPGTFGGGTVTSITAGTGLSGGTITGSGTIAIDSTVTTLTGSQVLTNKTLTAPTIADFTNAVHDHGDNDDGGVLPQASIIAAGGVGFIGYANDTGNRNTTNTTDGTALAIAALTATFTAVSGAIYRIRATGLSQNSGAGNGTYIQIWEGTVGSGTKKKEHQITAPVANYAEPILIEYLGTLTAGSVTINIGMKVSAGTGYIRGDVSATTFTVERLQ